MPGDMLHGGGGGPMRPGGDLLRVQQQLFMSQGEADVSNAHLPPGYKYVKMGEMMPPPRGG